MPPHMEVAIALKPDVASLFATLSECLERVDTHQKEIVARQEAIKQEMTAISERLAEVLQDSLEVVNLPLD